MTSYSKYKVRLFLVLLTSGILFLKFYKDNFWKTTRLDLGGTIDLRGSDGFSKSYSTTLSKGNVSTTSQRNDETVTAADLTLNYYSSTQNTPLDVVHKLFYNANVRYELLEQIMKLYPGFVDMIQWENLYGKLHYGGQRVLLNDCLYRNMRRVKYVVFSDLDEVIYPVSSDNWIDMLNILEKKGKYASYMFSNNFIAELAPNTTMGGNNSCPYMNLRKYFVRLRCLPWPDFKQNTKMKMIVKPEALSVLCIHDICKPTVSGYTKTYRVPMNVGLMAHYRVPVPHMYIYGEGVIDNTALKYRDQFIDEMLRVCSLIET